MKKIRCPDCKRFEDEIMGAEKQFCPQCGQQMEKFDGFGTLLPKICSNPQKDKFHDVHIKKGDFYCQICGFALISPLQAAKTQPVTTQLVGDIIQ